MSFGNPTFITFNIAHVLGNSTTTYRDIDYDNRLEQNDVIVTAETNALITDELSPYVVIRIVCLWILLIVGVPGNLLVLILVIWKRNRKQVTFFIIDARSWMHDSQ
jgi:hypothetical protein